MKPQDIQILKADLCARLPYGVRVKSLINSTPVKLVGFDGEHFYDEDDAEWNVEDIQPCLFPPTTEISDNSTFGFDYFNSNHIDYRGLIEKGLAIDASTIERNQLELWIARDEDGTLCLYSNKPVKDEDAWNTNYNNDYMQLSDFLFPNIKWSDPEPTKVTISCVQ